MHHRLKPYFSREEILRAIDNYVPTQCQNVDPAAAAEPARVHAFATQEKLIPFFIKKVFREKKEEKYYLVLADSGMGKTTFMINLFLKYSGKRFKTYRIVLVPLGHPKADEKIESVEDKPRTILLLDAFDEDIKAARDYKTRMQEIIDKTLDFQTVIITSRSQFFPSDPDIPQEIGLFKFGGDKGEHRFYRLYVSPFSQGEIHRYLRRKYPLYLWFKRCKAHSIVTKSPDLMVRPMLLANIEDLLAGRKNYRYTYEIYEEMVERWIKRERVKDKTELRKFSEVIARDMYENQQARGGFFILHDQVGRFAEKYGIRLDELEMRSRSLLNRNAEGKYKFAHKSILEYLLSLEIIRDPDFRAGFNYDNMEQTRRFYYEHNVIPFFSRPLSGHFQLFDKDRGRIAVDTKRIDIKKLDLKELENIAVLVLPDNGITDLTPMQELKNIQALDLRDNQITDLTPLKELKNVQVLSLSKNQITDLTPLLELTSLKCLYIQSNPITKNAAFEELKRRLGKNLII
ncbi:MAG: leucine-rich repeat domain-containing protein [Candidatus Aminicenantes bacterium]|nr:leucine-rich repeat domain-containing protein [Candidatus Aminicenantes bacterium]